MRNSRMDGQVVSKYSYPLLDLLMQSVTTTTILSIVNIARDYVHTYDDVFVLDNCCGYL